MRKASALAATVAITFVVVIPAPASATVTGPCQATFAGQDVTSGHGSPGDAVNVDVNQQITYTGHTTNGAQLSGVDVSFHLAGVTLATVHREAHGTDWTGDVSLSKYSWAAVGLYQVSANAIPKSGGTPVCTGLLYMCVGGKSPVSTAAGGAAALGGALSVILLALGGRKARKHGSRAAVATRAASAGLVGGASTVVLLQQACVAPLSAGEAIGAAAGGLAVLGIAGAALGTAAPPAPSS